MTTRHQIELKSPAQMELDFVGDGNWSTRTETASPNCHAGLCDDVTPTNPVNPLPESGFDSSATAGHSKSVPVARKTRSHVSSRTSRLRFRYVGTPIIMDTATRACVARNDAKVFLRGWKRLYSLGNDMWQVLTVDPDACETLVTFPAYFADVEVLP